MTDQPRFTALGKLISIVLVAGLITLGVYMIRRGGTDSPASTTTESGEAPEVAEVKVEVPKLAPPAPFQLRDNIVPIEISDTRATRASSPQTAASSRPRTRCSSRTMDSRCG